MDHKVDTPPLKVDICSRAGRIREVRKAKTRPLEGIVFQRWAQVLGGGMRGGKTTHVGGITQGVKTDLTGRGREEGLQRSTRTTTCGSRAGTVAYAGGEHKREFTVGTGGGKKRRASATEDRRGDDKGKLELATHHKRRRGGVGTKYQGRKSRRCGA